MLREGDQAPSFAAVLHTGELFRLQDIVSKHHLVLYFYPKDFTPGCTKEACSFRDNSDEIRTLGAVIIGVSSDTRESHVQFAQQHRLAFPLASDPNNDLARVFDVARIHGLSVRRVTYVIDKHGIIRGVIHHEVLVNNHWKKTIAILNILERESG